VFVGFAIGNLLSGQIGDRLGRRPSILLAYWLIGGFGFATGVALDPVMMVSLRFGVGLGCGIGFPSVYTVVSEVCPTHVRGSITTLMIGFMPLGEIFAALLVLFVDKDLDHSQVLCEMFEHWPNLLRPVECTWRTMCELSSLPAFVFLAFSTMLLTESPQYLVAHGRIDDARLVLQRMARRNGKTVDTGDLGDCAMEGPSASPTTYSFADALGQLVGGGMLCTVLFMMCAHFTKDFAVFGMNYVLPQYFHQLENHFSTGSQLLLMSFISLPGVAMAFALTRLDFIGHIPCMRGAAALAAFFSFGMLELTSTHVWGDASEHLGAFSAFLAKSMAMVYFICTGVYTSEFFPPKFRNTGIGLCVAFGRCGSISAPLIFELSYSSADGSFDVFVAIVMTSMLFISAFAGRVLTVETKGRQAAGFDAGSVSAEKRSRSYGSTD